MNTAAPGAPTLGDRCTTPVTTITLCGYAGAARLWAFSRMGSARAELARVAGMRFWRLLGTGKGNGFSLSPDFSRYGLLAVWDHAEAADRFLTESTLMAGYRQHAEEVWTLRLLAVQGRGAWAGVNPFLPLAQTTVDDGRPVAVLTRATIRWSKLAAFWGAVPDTSRALDGAQGLLASVGTGEMPWVRPATFSVWRDEAAMREYAYGERSHLAVIRRRRDEGWYAEELFMRFAPLSSEGSWFGRDPLAGLL